MRVAGIMGAVSAICGGIDFNGLIRDVIDGIRRERMARNIRRRWPGWKPRISDRPMVRRIGLGGWR